MLEFRHLYKSYRASPFALSIGNLTIGDGEVVGLLGANGCGKTTFLKTVMGLVDGFEGEVLVDGLPPSQQYGRMAFVTEEGSYFPDMTPMQYAAFLADFYPRFDRGRYDRLMAFFDLYEDEPIRKLSKGQRAKVEICAGFSKGAKYILLDEPFLGKDVFARRDFLKLMITSLKRDETIIVTTHLVDEIQHVIDRALIIHKGMIRVDMPMDELHEQGRTLEELLMETTGYKANRYREYLEE
ncbi:ABC transporter ATP-binding protein [Paenibacillus chungangensis]|uniref:ABC transporter ATP-binding protein n=1 Tax=Paenibacillus chungangensis TaxID=696535 RepID=A0ABW3HSJ3_9BACL